ncbi:MAG: hypothetical protein RAK22_02620, partial [Nanoarchaeota archaeon]|nr:hypothetical protein [Nanoarchaeota archaeon]
MKAQVFTLDLVIGLAIILAILSAAYYISNIYLSYVSSQNLNVDAIGQISSAVSAFADSSSTVSAIDSLQVSGKNTGYLTNTLNQEIPYPYELTVLADESYTTLSLPSVVLYSYVSPSFGGNSIYSLSKIIVIYNSSSACVDCNASIVARSSFPSENTTISVPKCSIF